MIYLLIVHVIASIPNITVTLGPFQGSTDNSTAISIYQNGTMNSDFDITKYPQLSCTPIELEKFKVTNFKYNSTANQTFTLPLVIQNNALPIVITSVKIQDYHSYSEIPIVSTQYPIYISTQGTILLSHVCSNVSTNTNYWAVKDVTITFQNYSALNFQYQFICDPDYHPARFDWSSIIHLVYVSLIIWLLARKGKIYSFKIVFKGTQPSLDYSKQPPFQGFTLYWPQALFYIALLVASMFLSLTYEEEAETVMVVIVYIFTAICTLHFLDEQLCAYKVEFEFLIKSFFTIKVSEIISAAITFILVFCYIYFSNPWFLGDILTICILGSLVRLLKIRSVKNAVLFFVPIMIVDVLCSIYVGATVRYEWDSLILKYFNTPLSQQVPYFRALYNKKCGWISVFNILFPGFYLGYVHRFDYCKGTLVYEIVGFFGLLIGLVLWVVVQYLVSFPLPTSIFTEVLMVLFSVVSAYSRNELKIFWDGQFFDELYSNPFKDSLDKHPLTVINLCGIGATDVEEELIGEKSMPGNIVKSGKNGAVINEDVFEGLQPKLIKLEMAKLPEDKQQEIVMSDFQRNLQKFKDLEKKNSPAPSKKNQN